MKKRAKAKKKPTNKKRKQVRAANTTYAQLDQRLEALEQRVADLEFTRPADAARRGLRRAI